MFGWKKKPAPPVEEAKPQGGAAALIAGVEKDVAGFDVAKRAYIDGRVAEMEAFMRSMMAEADREPMFHALVDDAKQSAGITEHDARLVLFEDISGVAAMALAKIYADKPGSVPNICSWSEHLATIFWQHSMLNNGHAQRT